MVLRIDPSNPSNLSRMKEVPAAVAQHGGQVGAQRVRVPVHLSTSGAARARSSSCGRDILGQRPASPSRGHPCPGRWPNSLDTLQVRRS
jgi:hypothetical protein